MRSVQAERQPLIAHLHELRGRLLWSSFFLLSGSIAAYFFYQPILDFLVRPLNKPLFYTSPGGAFELVVRVCLFSGFLLALPVFIYHLLRFLEPLIPSKSRGRILWFLVGSCVLVLAGIGFAYFISLPAALYFLGEFGSDHVQSLITTHEYFSFIMRYMLGFAVLFQLPLILLLINIISPLSQRKLMSYQRYVVVLSFILAAIITPTPDPLNQAIMAVPVILLYQVSVLTIGIINRSRNRKIH